MTNGTSQGLFVIIAVIIFGIFVMISYLLFQDKMTNGLSNIFCESFNIVNKETGLGKQNNCLENGNNDKEDDTIDKSKDIKSEIIEGEYRTKIRDKNDNLKETEVWVRLKENSNGTLTIVNSNAYKNVSNTVNTNESAQVSVNIKNVSLEIPYSIDGMRITDIEKSAFQKASFNGNFKENGVINIRDNSFQSAKFIGNFNVNKMIYFGKYSFSNSKFNWNFDARNVVKIDDSAFQESKFIGDFIGTNL